jgi:HPt (histidine-containing phosphotransfer) domain-containing protein
MVFMDCQMPEMDGFAATVAIREHERSGTHRIPIIAMTANTMQGDREACLKAGMDDYLSKPIELNDLRAMIQRWMPAEEPIVKQATIPSRRSLTHLDSDNSSVGADVQAVLPGLLGQPNVASTGTAMPFRKAGRESALLRRLAAAPTAGTDVPTEPVQTLDPKRIQRLRALQTADDPEFMNRLLQGFLHDIPAIFEALRVAIEAGDAEAVRLSAHRCKGSSANFGAQRLGALCDELERMGRSKILAGAGGCLQQIEAEWIRVRTALYSEQNIAA